MKPVNALRNKFYSTLATGTVLAFSVADANASGKTIGQASTEIVSQVKNVGTLAIAAAFLLGIIMVAGGLMKLKQASENQGQNPPYSAGLWRLGLGAGLLALPALATMLTSSGSLDSVTMTKSSGF